MSRYLVTWEIDIETDDEISAAFEAYEIMQRSDTTAVVFKVHDKDTNKNFNVDLEDHE